MESLFVSLISVALVIVATVSMTMNIFSSTVSVTDSWRKLEEHTDVIRRTSIQVNPPASYSGGAVNITVANNGQVNLTNFEHWEVFAESQSGKTVRLTYTSSPNPAANEWTIEGIFLTSSLSSPEVFDLNILNSWETAKLTVNLNPEMGTGESTKFTVSTDNGVTSECIVTRQ